jgi:nicotinamidase-related amidase
MLRSIKPGEPDLRGGRPLSRNAVLLVIDMQMGFDDPAWGVRNNPMAEANVAALLAAWRAAGAPVLHVHHDSPSPTGLLRPGTPGNAVKPEARPLAGERVYRKRVNSAFIGTSLEADLRRMGAPGEPPSLALCGLTTNHCVSTTARMAGNLGFDTFVVADATAAFARANLNGRYRPAEEVHNAALSDLQDEFAQVVDTWAVLAALAALEAAHV